MKNNKTYKARFITCLFFLSFSTFAQIIQDDVFVVDEKIFSYQEVCKFLTKRESPLITFHSINKLDCMGSIVEVSSFCDAKTQEDPYYIRAIVDKEEKNVVCKSAKRVTLKYKCKMKNDEYCQDKEVGCYLFQEKLAKRLRLVHSSLMQQGTHQVLNCHFTPKNDSLETLPRP